MNGKQLKNSILQWAIQGKLVPQDPNDEPASVLLEKIRGEKERLIKEKKIKRDKNASIIYRGEDNSYYEKILATGEVKCIDEEIPFEIPKGWEWVHLETILNIGSARRVHAKDWRTVGIPFYRAREIGKLADDGFVDNELYIDQSLYEEFSSSGIPLPKDLMVTAVGTLGKVYIVKDKDKFYYKDGSVLCLANKYGLCAEYLKMVIESPSFKMQYKQESQGTTVATLTMVRLQKYFIPLPPLQEQYRIVKKLAELLPQIDKYSKVQNQLDELNTTIKGFIRKSILQKAIQGKLVPQIAEEGTAQELLEQIKTEKQKLFKEGKLKKSALNESVIFRGDDNKYWEKSGDNIVCIDEEIPFGIPSSWSWCRLGNIASVKGGKRIPVGEKLTTENTGHMYIRVADMKENTVKTDDIHYISESIYQKIKSYTISTEDLYITVAGTIGSVGEIPKVFDNANLTENADKIVFRGICKKFLMYCLLSNFVQSQIKKCTTKVGQPKLAIVRIEDLVIPLPPIKEQYRIVHKIEQTASIMSK